MAKRDGIVIHKSKSLQIKFYPDHGDIVLEDLTAPSGSDSCSFFPAREFLRAAKNVVKALPGEIDRAF